VSPDGISTLEIPHDDYDGVLRKLDELKPESAIVNITGGNKLMILAVAKWAESKSFPCVYLERGNRLVTFRPDGRQFATSHEPLDIHKTDPLPPLDLVCCQLSDSEILRQGQRLTLNDQAREIPDADFWGMIQSRNPVDYLHREGPKDRRTNEGDRLEYLAALVILKLGAPEVIRGLELKVRHPRGNPHAEIDLLFNYGAQLWVVDCKDRKSMDWVVKNVENKLGKDDPAAERVRSAFSLSGMKEMKDDMISATITGGLRAGILCIRKSGFNETEMQYAADHSIHVAAKRSLYDDLRRILNPDASP
jgi:hypothetical protein